MKRLWARVGKAFVVSDEDYEKIKEAIKNEDVVIVNHILNSSNCYLSGESYLPANCDDNPNEEDFGF